MYQVVLEISHQGVMEFMAGQNVGKSTMTKADIVEKCILKLDFPRKKLLIWLRWFSIL